MRSFQEEEILELSRKRDIAKLGLREIGKLLDIKNPQTVKYYIRKLERDGLLDYFKRRLLITEAYKEVENFPTFISVPILGGANCGDATIFAVESNNGFLKISKNMLEKTKNIFALIACGDSMNESNVNGKNIEDGDFIIVDSEYKVPKNNDVVVSIINGMANIKKFFIDRRNNQIVLIPESSNKNHLPIFIDPEEQSNYFVNGRVIQVIKKPKIR